MFQPSRLVAAAVLTGAVAACSGSGAAANPTATADPPKPTFTIEVAPPLSKTYKSDGAAVTASCRTPATGPWTLEYLAAGGTLGVSLTVYDGAAAKAGSNDFILQIAPGESSNEPVLQMAPSGREMGAHGSTGSVTVSSSGSTRTVIIKGVAYVRQGNSLNPLTFELTCPAAA